jgi:hypothetical protein
MALFVKGVVWRILARASKTKVFVTFPVDNPWHFVLSSGAAVKNVEAPVVVFFSRGVMLMQE